MAAGTGVARKTIFGAFFRFKIAKFDESNDTGSLIYYVNYTF